MQRRQPWLHASADQVRSLWLASTMSPGSLQTNVPPLLYPQNPPGCDYVDESSGGCVLCQPGWVQVGKQCKK